MSINTNTGNKAKGSNKVLITGGAGFIGSHIADCFISNGNETIIVDNLSTGNISNINKKAKFYETDICDENFEKIFNKENPDIVIHLAAQTSVNSSINNPIIDAELNILASIKLLELCRKNKIKKFLAASSAAVYGNPINLPIDENSKTLPLSPYGLSKLTMEKYIQLSEVPYIIFRFSNVFGPRQASSQESGVIAIFDRLMRENKEIQIFGDGNQIRDFIFVKDIAKACYKIANSTTENEIMNLSTSTGITIKTLFEEMSVLYGYNKQAKYLDERPGDIRNSILSNKKITSLIKNLEFTDFKKGLTELKDYINK